jgi:CHAT domain-containing protein
MALAGIAMVCAAQKPLPPVDPALNQAMNDGESLQKKSDYSGALERFGWCVARSCEIGDERGLAICLQLIGGIERLEGSYPEAEVHYNDALRHAENAGDQARVSYVLNNLAGLFVAQDRFTEAAEMLNGCLEIDRREGITTDAAPYQNLGIIYAMQGDHARALQSFLAALAIYEKSGKTNKIALTHYNLGELQLKQGNYAAARRELTEGRRLGEESGDQYVIFQALGDLGRLQEIEGDTAAARASIGTALELCRKSGFKVCIGESEVLLGDLHAAHAELEEAASAYSAARDTFTGLNDPYNTGRALRGLANVARLRSDFAAAAGLAAQAAELAAGVSDPDGEWESRALLALTAADSGDTAGARGAYREAIRIIENQRGKVGGGEAEQQRFFEKAVYPYRQLALLEASDHRPLDALRAAESARARVLLDMIGGLPERIARAMTDDERSEETRLLGALAGANAAIAQMANASAGPRETLRKKRDDAWARYESFRARLYVRKPELRAWRGESPAISEEEVIALLPDSASAILEFVCAEDRVLLLAITRDSGGRPRIETFPIAIRREALAARTAAYRALLEGRSPGFRPEGRALYDLLLRPAAGALAGKKRVYLVPDGPLWELPFQTLIDRAGRYWIETAAIAWAPSLTFLRDQSHRTPGPTSLDLVAFGDPVGTGVTPVPALREQLARIAALYEPGRSAVRVGQAADEKSFQDLAPRARIIHLATHGVADPENSMRSRVLLTASGEAAGGSGTSRDGWLEAWELMRLDLNADTVILSACETGRGHSPGEGLVGFAWALFVAGARHSVVSQWDVESVSTTELMTALHKGLRRGEDPASALRLGMLSLIRNPRYRHPYYWGAFIAAGSF